MKWILGLLSVILISKECNQTKKNPESRRTRFLDFCKFQLRTSHFRFLKMKKRKVDFSENGKVKRNKNVRPIHCKIPCKTWYLSTCTAWYLICLQLGKVIPKSSLQQVKHTLYTLAPFSLTSSLFRGNIKVFLWWLECILLYWL